MISLISVTLAYMIGIAWGLYFESSIQVLAPTFLCFILSITLYLKKKINFQKGLEALLLFTVFLIGIFYCQYRINLYEHRYREGIIEGNFTITSSLKETNYYYMYHAKNENKNQFLLYFKKTDTSVFPVGSKIFINGNFSLGSLKRNPGGFDYRLYLESSQIYGSITVTSFQVESLKSHNQIYFLQNKIHNFFKKLFSNEVRGILNCMLVGDSSEISDETKQNFQNSGIIHLLAISGTHMIYVLYFSKFIFEKIVGKKYSSYFNILFITFFMTLTGFSPSVVRSRSDGHFRNDSRTYS